MSQTDFAYVDSPTIKAEDDADNVTVIFTVKMAHLGNIVNGYDLLATFSVTGGIAAMESAIAATVRALYLQTFGSPLAANSIRIESSKLI